MLFDEFKQLAAEYGFSDLRVSPGLAVLSFPYQPFAIENNSDTPSEFGVVSAYYVTSNKAREALSALILALKERGIHACAVGNEPHKSKACIAGLGHYGKNQLIIHSKFGTRFNIQLLVVDSGWDCEDSPKTEREICSGCNKCIAACPTSALTDEGFDREKCLRHHMLNGKVVPVDMRRKMGMRLVGCEVCQQACPHNANIGEGTPPDELMDALLLEGILSDGEKQKAALAVFEKLLGKNYAKTNRILTQAAICAGNSGNTRLIPYLEVLIENPNEAVSEHAKWAVAELSKI